MLSFVARYGKLHLQFKINTVAIDKLWTYSADILPDNCLVNSLAFEKWVTHNPVYYCMGSLYCF